MPNGGAGYWQNYAAGFDGPRPRRRRIVYDDDAYGYDSAAYAGGPGYDPAFA